MANALPDVTGYETYLKKSTWGTFNLHEASEDDVRLIMKGSSLSLAAE